MMGRLTRAIAFGFLALVVTALGLGSAALAADEVVIEVVHVDLDGGTITITGEGFENPQDTQVELGGVPLTILSESASVIVAALPAGTAPGSYLLDVWVTGGTSRSDEFDVRISNEPELEARIAVLEALLAGLTRSADAFTGVDTLRLTGANLQIVNGTGHTDDTRNGAGNLILGYNAHTPLNLRTGSHTLVIGDHHTYTKSSGIIAGYNHALNGVRSSIIGGGDYNDVSSINSIVAGGHGNSVVGDGSATLGGVLNIANGESSFVGAGLENVTDGSNSFIGGGSLMTAPNTCGRIALGWCDTSNICYCTWQKS